MQSIIERTKLRDFDWVTAGLAVTITLFGSWMISLALPTEPLWQKQLIGLAIALVAFLVVSFSDYRRIVDAAPIFYGLSLLLLVLVLVPGLGVKVNGQTAWLRLPIIGQFQPSEFAKVPAVLMLARYFGRRKSGPLRLREFMIGLGILALPVGLILLEPDAGQAITYFPLLGAVLFLSGVKVRYVLIAVAAALIFVPASYWIGVKTGKIKPYQQERINVIIDPESADPRGYGYHTVQSMITVGRGGVVGIVGESDTSQAKLKFLPEPQTDFIFAVTAENTGFIGCLALLIAYGVLLTRLISGARGASDRSGMLVVMSITVGMTFQIFMNMGMVLGFLPVIGVPLPLMSAGLSAVLATFIALGFGISVKIRRFVN